MKIYVHGKLERYFQCPRCHCVFSAKNEEYYEQLEEYGKHYYCQCPECEEKAREVCKEAFNRILSENGIMPF